ncbi:MAG: hydroxymethylbilane synthase [Pseudomonadota bacterium]
MNKKRIVIGARGSALSLTQARWTAARLEEAHPGLVVEFEIIKTKGDKILDAPLAKVGGKGLFVKEIEDALLEGRVDLAVHSMKDVPTDIPAGLVLASVPKREDFRDALVSRGGERLESLPRGARVGTSSLRRQAQLLFLRPDLKIETLRGNLDTRLRKLVDENFDAIVLAAAGLNRMNLQDRASQLLDPDVMLPAIGQGALGLEVRVDDPDLLDLVAALHHEPTAVCVAAERAFLLTMEGGCQVPLGALARLDRGRLFLTGLVADPEGRRLYKDSLEVAAARAEEAGRVLAGKLLDRGGREIMAELYGSSRD